LEHVRQDRLKHRDKAVHAWDVPVRDDLESRLYLEGNKVTASKQEVRDNAGDQLMEGRAQTEHSISAVKKLLRPH
jgi:hypothetical protein